MTGLRRTLTALFAAFALVVLGACAADIGDTGVAADAGDSSEGADSGASEGGGDSDSASEPDFTVTDAPVATGKVMLPPSYKFEPAAASVSAGDTVTWENQDNFPHNVKVFELDRTVDLPIGKTATITFDEPGTYLYQCTLHPTQMKGKVVVEA